MWHKRWAVLQPRSGSQPAYVLFYKKSVVRRQTCRGGGTHQMDLN
jgi:hypothetical protein